MWGDSLEFWPKYSASVAPFCVEFNQCVLVRVNILGKGDCCQLWDFYWSCIWRVFWDLRLCWLLAVWRTERSGVEVIEALTTRVLKLGASSCCRVKIPTLAWPDPGNRARRGREKALPRMVRKWNLSWRLDWDPWQSQRWRARHQWPSVLCHIATLWIEGPILSHFRRYVWISYIGSPWVSTWGAVGGPGFKVGVSHIIAPGILWCYCWEEVGVGGPVVAEPLVTAELILRVKSSASRSVEVK